MKGLEESISLSERNQSERLSDSNYMTFRKKQNHRSSKRDLWLPGICGEEGMVHTDFWGNETVF